MISPVHKIRCLFGVLGLALSVLITFQSMALAQDPSADAAAVQAMLDKMSSQTSRVIAVATSHKAGADMYAGRYDAAIQEFRAPALPLNPRAMTPGKPIAGVDWLRFICA